MNKGTPQTKMEIRHIEALSSSSSDTAKIYRWKYTLVFFIITIIFLLIAAHPAYSYTITSELSNNSIILSINDTSLQGIDLGNNYTLQMYVNGQSYRYFGKLIFPITIAIDSEADYRFILVDKSTQEHISETNISSNINCSNLALAPILGEYSVGDKIPIDLIANGLSVRKAPSYVSVEIISGNMLYRLVGKDIQDFTLTNPGDYSISLKCNDQSIDVENFTSINGDNTTSVENNLSSSGEGDQNVSSDVLNETIYTLKKMTLRDSKGDVFIGDVKTYGDRRVNDTSLAGRILSIFSGPQEKEIINRTDINLDGVSGLEKVDISLNNLEYNGNTLYAERVQHKDLINKNKINIKGDVIDAFALDLSQLKFTNGTLTKLAKGRELWKCKDWDFSQQKCTGTWSKVLDIRPGENYTIEVSQNDPGYIETGLATINTDRSIYRPGQFANIFMVVLDTNGYLVENATIDVQVVAPDNTVYFYDNYNNHRIIQYSKGIYKLAFTNTGLEGNYSMFVHAVKNGSSSDVFVDYTMSSYFTVISNYDFDIVRNTPVTTDPFEGPFKSQISVAPLASDISNYDFTEVLPNDVTVVEAPGAAMSFNNDTNSTYLTWNNLNGNVTLNYTAQPPLITPNLLILGKAFVSYVVDDVTKIFEEARNWFMAVDPTTTRDQGLVVYANRNTVGLIRFRNWTGTLLQAEQNTPFDLGGSNIVWQKFRCMKTFPQCVLVSEDNGAQIYFSVFHTDTWTWDNGTVLTANAGNSAQWNFDVDCDGLTNNCLMAYENITTDDMFFTYRIWNGTKLSSEVRVNVTVSQGFTFDWIRLYPKKNSTTMGIVIQDTDGGSTASATPNIYGGIWNGTAFGNWQTFTNDGPHYANNARIFFRHFDCGWEGGTAKLTCLFANDTANAVQGYSFNGTKWNYLGLIYNMSTKLSEFAVCGQDPYSNFNHSYLGMMFSSATTLLDGGYWNGTTFSKTAANQMPAQNPNAEVGTNKGTAENGQNFQCSWERSGDRILYVWVNNGQSFLTSGLYSISGNSYTQNNWTAGTQIVASGAGQLRTSTLVSNPGSDKEFLVYSDAARDAGCSLWTGNTWDGSGCNNSAVFETNGATAARNWITFDWFRNPPPQPIITLITPITTSDLLDYTGILSPSSTSEAFDGSTTQLPPVAANAPITGTEFSSSAYANISSLDGIDHTSTVLVSGGLHAYQSFNFSVPESTVSMTSIVIDHMGYATGTTSLTASNFSIYVYNWSSDTYVLEKFVFPSAVDTFDEITLTGGFTDFVRYKTVYVLVEGGFATAAGASARADMSTDYISLNVSNIPLLRNNITVNVTATDDNGVNFCEWRFYNSTNGNQTNLTRMTNTDSSYYFNVSNITKAAIPDGYYNATVFCNGSSRTNVSQYVYVDNTAPVINLVVPKNASNFTVSSVLFTWNVTDIFGENMNCNLTIDSVVAASNVVSLHGDNTTKNITGIVDGTHFWNVTCQDDAGNLNSSVTWMLDTDTGGPAITLNNPGIGVFTNQNPLDLNFTAIDAHAIVNCSVYIDNVLNNTFYNLTNGQINNLTLTNLNQGIHKWNVTCFDSFNWKSNSSTINFTEDYTAPAIYLNISNGIVFNGTIPQLNYTVIDNVNNVSTCNITVNSAVVDPNIASKNNTYISRNESLLSGFKLWNVTCWDSAGNVNTSVMGNFRVIGGPSILLINPPDNNISNGYNITFIYNATDGVPIANCSLIIDNIINQKNLTITSAANSNFSIANLSEGLHTWNISCWNTDGYLGISVTRNITSDRTPPGIILNSPGPGQTVTVTPTQFSITLADALSKNATCNLTVDSNVSAANKNFIAINGSTTIKTQTLTNGIHWWNVTCIDQGGNINTSINLNFTVNVTFSVNVTVVAGKHSYQEGELALVNVTTRNETNSLISANITLDYIYTNNTITDTSWWNTSWANRRPIFINESQGLARTNKVIAVNVTGISIPIGSSCAQDLRVIADVDLLPRAFNVIAGDDVTWCYIQFNGSVSANAANENNYHVYYNYNDTPINPGYTNLLSGMQVFFDNFTVASLSTNWTTSNWTRANNNPTMGFGGNAHINGVVTNSTITLTSPLNLSLYDVVNITFVWRIDTWTAADFLRLDYSNNSGTTWTGDPGIAFLTGVGDNNVNRNFVATLNTSYMVDKFNIRFRATIGAAGRNGGFDNFNITAWYVLQSNVTTSVGNEQDWISRDINTTNATTGMYKDNFTTSGRTYGNYTAVALASPPDINHRSGTGYDWFNIIKDTFGPVISILYPSNASTLHSGNISFNYTASDFANHVANCSLFINGTFNQMNKSVNETGLNTFIVYNMTEGKYNWSISCNDTLSNPSNTSTYILYLDDTPPVINLISPNNALLAVGGVNFTFNVTDNLASVLSCNLSVDNANYSKLLNVTSRINSSTVILNISTGLHYWNMTCYDNINNTNTSSTFNFTIVSIPVVKLDSPVDGYGVNSTNITLYYNLSSSNIANCSLMLNGILNSTQNSSQIQFQNNDGKNNFTLLNMSYGVYNWTVLCFDINNFNGTDTVRMFQLDNIAPNISLIFPGNGNVVFSRNINFTFNVTDIDNILVCNLTIDGILNSTNFNATSSAITGVYVPKMSVTNHTWNVTCIDNTGFSSISSTWNFTINSNVSVSLVNPPNGNLTNSSGPSLSYIPSSPADFDLGFCDLYIDSSVYSTHVALTSGSQDTFGTSNLANGIHFWFVNCTDDVGKVGLSVTWNFTIDRTPPVVTIYYPNGTLLNVSSVFFNWTAIDNIAPNMTCNVRVNGTVQSPGNIFSINNSVTNSTYSGFTDGLSVWNVTCTDTVGNSNTSTTLNFTVEEPPSVGLGNPPNNNRTRNGNITFFYTPKDNSGSIGNCTFILDGSANFTNKTITNNVQNNFTLYNISEGAHNWTVNCTDLSGNTGTNLSVKNFTIDLTAPNVSLIYPPEGSFLSGAINFNWTATDYAGVQISCGLFLDGNYTNKTVSKVSGSSFNTTLTNISSGPHNWSVNCSDDLNNYVMSGVGNFTVNQPDLYIDSSRIQFNNTNPDENQTINITANVTNIGGVDVGNVFVNFYDGDPSLGLIIGNSTGSVVVNGSRIFSAIWNITTGYHTIFVSVDPYNAVSEINENNNNATLNISILRSIVAAPQNNSAFVNPNITVNFTLQDFSGGNINYSVIVDGALNGQNGSVVDGVLTLINVSINQGLHYIVIQGTDALGRSKNSSRVYVTVDYTPPATVINTINNTWFNYSTPQINISATDNVYTNISYIIYVNGTANINGTILSGTSALVNLTSLANGYYQIQMQAWDFLNNTNTTIKFINVDTAIPSITLNSPNDGTNFTVRTVTLNYTVNDNLAATANCSITLDGLNVKNSTVNISQVNTFVLNNLAEGTHYWNVTCTDLAKNLNYSSTRSFNVYIAPNITIISPPDNYWSNALSNTFYFNVSDETGLTNCSILINGTISQTKNTSQLINNAQNNFTVVFVNSGNYTWAIECYDNTTFRAYNISLNRTLLVDVIKPQPSIITLGGSWFSNATPQISFNITDNMANTLNYTFYVNNTANVNGSVNNNTVSSASLQGLTNGTYTIVLEATDIAGNKQNSSIISITIDTVKPSINLTTPLNATNISVNYADLNFTPRDNLASYLICNLTLDGVITASNLNVSNSQKQNVSIQSLKGGNHYWNVTCFDQAGNINTSQTFSFYVQMPDLYINNSLIFFSNNNPIENDTINITAELHNVGNVDAFNFTTQIWANSPSTGILILNITLNLSSNHSINITTNYTMPIGDTPFYVLLDTPLASNGSVMEGNESNNNASASIHVGLWEYVMGNISANLALINNQSIYSWFINNASGGKIYAADADSNVHWFTLQALGRNVSNQSSSADFYTLDTKINSTILTDSVNRTYTQANLPIDTQNFTLFNRRVLNVPVVNSTNTSNFKTGILWDYGDGGLVYNGSQNIVFVSTINTSIQGYNSTEDYEIRVPATLRSYKGSVNQVVFYGELI